MSSPKSAEQADAQIAEAQDNPSSSSPSGYRSVSVSPPESPRSKKDRLELEHDPDFVPTAADDEVHRTNCFYVVPSHPKFFRCWTNPN